MVSLRTSFAPSPFSSLGCLQVRGPGGGWGIRPAAPPPKAMPGFFLSLIPCASATAISRLNGTFPFLVSITPTCWAFLALWYLQMHEDPGY